MSHVSVYRRMLVWGIGTLMAMVGAAKIAEAAYIGFPTVPLFCHLLLFFGGMALITVNEVIFNVKKAQLEIEATRGKRLNENHSSTSCARAVLATCPRCKGRIPANSKYCLECGTDL